MGSKTPGYSEESGASLIFGFQIARGQNSSAEDSTYRREDSTAAAGISGAMGVWAFVVNGAASAEMRDPRRREPPKTMKPN